MKNWFENAVIPPLTREEMIGLIERRGAPRPAVACGHWLHIHELNEEDQDRVREALTLYPEDIQVFYLNRPSFFIEDGCRYTWCDVPGADPRIGRTRTVGVDEETAISWEIYDQISDNVPDCDDPSMYQLAPEDDGRYRMVWFQNGPWQKATDYRGMTNALMDLYLNPEGMKHITRRVTDFFKAAIERGVRETRLDAIMFGDDLGMQKGAFMSNDMFREFLFPYYKEICDHAHRFGLHVWFHCCGDCFDLIPQLIEAGIDVLHPVQKYAMDEKKVADAYKDDLCFWAGMDLQQILPFGTAEDVKEEVHHMIDTFYQPNKGGLVLTLGNRLQNNVPIDNFLAFLKAAHEYALLVGKKQEESV